MYYEELNGLLYCNLCVLCLSHLLSMDLAYLSVQRKLIWKKVKQENPIAISWDLMDTHQSVTRKSIMGMRGRE